MASPVEPRFVDAAETALGLRFPPAYRARLLRENGGELDVVIDGEVDDDGWWLFPVRDDSTPKRLSRTWDDVVRQSLAARGARGIPEGAVVIGDDGGGDLLLLALRDGGDALEACRWDHETGELTWLSLEQLFSPPARRSEQEFHESIDACFPYLDRAVANALIDEALTIGPAAVFDVVHELARRPRDSGVPDAVCLSLLDRIAARLEHPLAAEVLDVARGMVAGRELTFDECAARMRRIAAFPGQYAALHVIYFACDEPGMEAADRLLNEINAAWAEEGGGG